MFKQCLKSKVIVEKLKCYPKYIKKNTCITQQIVYTDGSVRLRDKYTGIGLWYNHLSTNNTHYRLLGRDDSNRAELAAIYTALAFSDMRYPLTINTDSLNSIEMIEEHYYENVIHPSYQQLLLHINQIIQYRDGKTYISKVPAHKNNVGNNNADRLAKTAPLNRYIIMPDNTVSDVITHINKQFDV